ncbi:DNA recombination and repair protein RecA [Cynara cardunculus var. scolymus]|uniref:DNA recombination and repair protein RecA n=1 Tax=Cynara cardunculus var. scolymus TaxID=59895 RepID=A0A103YJN4_CYNCS|nr:DNA recombination and repair protein RecA [Cynara cardunculus var. scolymus]
MAPVRQRFRRLRARFQFNPGVGCHFILFSLAMSLSVYGIQLLGKKKSKSDGSDSALKQAIDQINTSHGKGSIMFLCQCASPRQVPVVSTGPFALDIALGVGGFPKAFTLYVCDSEVLIDAHNEVFLPEHLAIRSLAYLCCLHCISFTSFELHLNRLLNDTMLKIMFLF